MHEEVPAMAGYEDDELVRRAQGFQGSDSVAFGELMRRTSASSLRLAMSILRDRQEAEDEVQNSYVKAWRHLGQFQLQSKFSTWISRIVMNQCLMRLRKLRGTSFVYLDDESADERLRQPEVTDRSATPEVELRDKELSGMLQREIRRLPPILRHVLLLRDVDELSTAEVANRLSISAAGVKSRLSRARIELRNRMEKHAGRAGRAMTHC